MITPQTYYNLSTDLIEAAETLSARIMRRVRSFALKAVKESPLNERVAIASIDEQYSLFERDLDVFADEQVPEGYLEGVQDTNGNFRRVKRPYGEGNIPARQVFSPVPPTAPTGSSRVLRDYPRHTTMIGAFQEAVRNEGDGIRMNILRDSRDVFRDIQIEAGLTRFREADEFTRRQLQNDIVERFADRGVTGITYANGRRVMLESYSEVLSRTTIGNAARQASLNRNAELGNDLVQMSWHSRSSDLCEPWQGRVYSETGDHPHYPPLQDAINEGAFHPNCLHSLSPYFPGVSEALEKPMDPGERRVGNKAAYEAEQRQREMERHIRKWKRRESASLVPGETEKASRKVKEWQAAQREHLDQFEFLPRRYGREQI